MRLPLDYYDRLGTPEIQRYNRENPMTLVQIEHKGEKKTATQDKAFAVADEMVERLGPGIPKMTEVECPPPAAPEAMTPVEAVKRMVGMAAELEAMAPAPIAVKPMARAGLRAVDKTVAAAVGHARVEADVEAAKALGFADLRDRFDQGVERLDNMTGGARFLTKRIEWERMPLTVDACRDLRVLVTAEDRQEHVATIEAIRMAADGDLLVTHGANECLRLRLSERAFGQLINRLGIAGGAKYLTACWPELRAHNVNAWLESFAVTEAKARDEAKARGVASKVGGFDARFRHRLHKGEPLDRDYDRTPRTAFATVGPKYSDFDADQIAEAIAVALDSKGFEHARGRVSYDGERARFEILFNSTVQPKHAVTGEIFRAGAVVRTDDTGSGSIGGNAVVHQALCLNMCAVRTSDTAHFAVRHHGDVGKLARQFGENFLRTLGAVDHFVRAWDLAVESNVVEAVRARATHDLPSEEGALMAGIFRNALARKLVPIPVRASTVEAHVDGLMQAWGSDTSGAQGPTRAAVVNAFTRYAHSSGRLDPWAEDEIQTAAGDLLARTKRGDAFVTTLGFTEPEEIES